jgi:hypothetical protein
MPMDRAKYPPDWERIRTAILARAGDRCERCGVANHAYGARDRDGTWHDADDIEAMNGTVGAELFGDFPKMIRIVLTVAHLNHDTTDNRDENLKPLCQRCHLNHDREHHMRNAAETRRRRRMEKGQLALIGGER